MTEYSKGRIEQRRFERVVSAMPVQYYAVDDKMAAQLAAEKAYKDTHVESLAKLARPDTVMTGVTENISAGGFALICEQFLPVGTHVVVDLAMPTLPRSLRALGRVMHSEAGGGTVDRTALVYKSGLQIIAVNHDDMRRIENHILEQKLKGQR